MPFISSCRVRNQYRYAALVQLRVSPLRLIVLLGKFGPWFKEGLMTPIALFIVLFLGLFIWYACTINILHLCGTLASRGCHCLASFGNFAGACDIFEYLEPLWSWTPFIWCYMILSMLSRRCLWLFGPIFLLIRSWIKLGGCVCLLFISRTIRSGHLLAKALLPRSDFACLHIFHAF